MDADEVVVTLGLDALPAEGGRFRRTWADAHSSAIYFLLTAPEVSALHRLDGPEVYHFYAGAPVRLLLLHPGGMVTEPVLGPDLAAGQRPQVVVEAGVWQACEPLGPWALLGTTMAPPFEWGAFSLGSAAELTEGWPAAAHRISRFVR